MLLADQLLHADNLHGQRAFVHETSAKSKALQAAWRAAIEISGKVWIGGVPSLFSPRGRKMHEERHRLRVRQHRAVMLFPASQVGRSWSCTRLGLQRGLLEGMLHAAECAVAMHDTWLPAEEEEEEEDLIGGSAQGLTGAWGGGTTGEAATGVVTDEDVQVRVREGGTVWGREGRAGVCVGGTLLPLAACH